MDYFTLHEGFYFELYNLMTMKVLGPFLTYEACEMYRNSQVLMDNIQNTLAGTDTTLITTECWEWWETEEL